MAMQLRNVAYAVDCYRYAHKIGSGKFIFPGSASEYAYSDKPIDGVSVLPAPCDAYAAVKASVHICLELTARQLGLPYVRILLPSIYGGQRSDANIITYTVRALLRGERPAFSKLEQMWEYVYIDDAVRALVQIGERGISGKSYPVGWGRKTTLAEYIRMVRDSIDPALALGIGEQPYKTGRVDHCIMDPTQTITDTQYFPVVRFEDGIRQTIDYIRRKMPPMSNNLHET
jgi:nucleoside-diphosphate-sugar epimerase